MRQAGAKESLNLRGAQLDGVTDAVGSVGLRGHHINHATVQVQPTVRTDCKEVLW